MSKRMVLLILGLLLPIRETIAREQPSVAWKVLLYFAAGNNLRPEYEAQLDELRCLCLGGDVEVLILFDRGNPPAGAPCPPPARIASAPRCIE